MALITKTMTTAFNFSNNRPVSYPTVVKNSVAVPECQDSQIISRSVRS